MKVVVTGGSGLAGHFVVEDLVDHGHEVLSVDRVRPARAVAPFRLADLLDLGQTYDCLAGAQAVVHYAAIPRPIYDTDDVVFRTNVMTTFNVLEAAARLGVRRVVLASSVSVLGLPFNYHYIAPRDVPIDEEHPSQPQDPYALSKVIGEEIAKAFVRRTGMTAVSLRLAWIHTPATFKEQLVPLWDDPAGGAANLWSYVDSRDSAQACRHALTADISGHEAFFIAAANSFMKIPTAELVRKYYPEAVVAPDLEGNAPILKTAKAERMLGYKPEYRWEDYF
jgi:nucleoside-diphosphate-sugar epimerase